MGDPTSADVHQGGSASSPGCRHGNKPGEYCPLCGKVVKDDAAVTKHQGSGHDQKTHGRWAQGARVGTSTNSTATVDARHRADAKARDQAANREIVDRGRRRVRNLVERTLKRGGFTYSPTKGIVTKGYAVALEGYEKRVPPGTSRADLEKSLASYVRENREVFRSNDKVSLGGWMDTEGDGSTYWDLSEVHTDRDAAISAGRERNQLAIFDLDSSETIDLRSAPDREGVDKSHAPLHDQSPTGQRRRVGRLGQGSGGRPAGPRGGRSVRGTALRLLARQGRADLRKATDAASRSRLARKALAEIAAYRWENLWTAEPHIPSHFPALAVDAQMAAPVAKALMDPYVTSATLTDDGWHLASGSALHGTWPTAQEALDSLTLIKDLAPHLDAIAELDWPEAEPSDVAKATEPSEDEETQVGYHVAKATGDESRFTLGPVYIPNEIDAHRDFATPEQLQKTLWSYSDANHRDIRLQHHPDVIAGRWVELVSWPYETTADLALPDGTVNKATLPPGTPYMGVIWEPWAWDLVKKGKLRGYSMGGRARRVSVDLGPEATEVAKELDAVAQIIEHLGLDADFANRYDGGGYVHGDGFRSPPPDPEPEGGAPPTEGAEAPLAKHQGPGAHRGTGTPQKVHAPGGGGGGAGPTPGSERAFDLATHLENNPRRPGEETFVYQSRVLDGLDPELKHDVLAAIRERYDDVDEAAAMAQEYRESKGLPEPKVDWNNVTADMAKARQIAEIYNATPDQSTDPRVIAAYDDFKRQNEEMYSLIESHGYTIEFPKVAEPYPSAEAQARDLDQNRRLRISHAEILLGGQPHPLMTNDEYNRFRAVHDFFGHTAIGGGFDRHGEYAAWLVHRSMYTGEGAKAMSTEYHGTNSVLWSTGTPAQTKAILLPDELIEGIFDDEGNQVKKHHVAKHQGPGSHPGSGTPQKVHSGGGGSSARPRQIASGDMAAAADAIARGEFIQLSTKREVSTLLDHLHAVVQDAKEKGEAAPNYDLCKVSVPGTNVFCQESKGIARIKMPQLSGPAIVGSKADALSKDPGGGANIAPQFVEHLRDSGAIVASEEVLASSLKATQRELVGSKVAGIAKAMESGTMKTDLPPIFVSNDNYILDGHHRWAATVGVDWSDDTDDLTIDTFRVDKPISELLSLANDFSKEWGIAPKSGGGGVAKRARIAAVDSAIAKHLPGQHDQRSHGNWAHGRGGGGGGGGESGDAEKTFGTATQAMIAERDRIEPAVTADLKDLAAQAGGEMAGLEWRKKADDKIADKIARKSYEKGIPRDQVEITDVLRYTMNFPHKTYMQGVGKAIKGLQERGYKVRASDIENNWHPGDAYDGINMLFSHPDGMKIELQFHTPESWVMKDKVNHPLFEEFRNPATPFERQKELHRQMTENTSMLERPHGYAVLPMFVHRPFKG